MTTPNTGIPYVTENTLDPAAALNQALNVVDALLQTMVIAMDLSAPPGGAQDGDLYIVGPGPTGAWAGRANDLARFVAQGAFWQFYEAGAQVRLILNREDGGLYIWSELDSPGAWEFLAIAGGLLFEDDNSPPVVSVPAVTTVVIGAGLALEQIAPGVVRLTATT